MQQHEFVSSKSCVKNNHVSIFNRATIIYEIMNCKTPVDCLRGVISKIGANWGMVIIGDTANPNSALCIHNFELFYCTNYFAITMATFK